MVARPLVAACVVAALLSGCVGQAPEPEERSRGREAQESAVSALGGRFAAPVVASADAQAAGPSARPAASADGFEVTPQVLTTDAAPWYLAALPLQPHGASSLAGYRWTLPEGSVQEHEDYEWAEGVSIEVAFVEPARGSVGNVSIFWFRFDGDEPTLLGAAFAFPYTRTERLTPGVVREDTEAFTLPGPHFMYFDQRIVEDGDEMGLVVAAQGDADAFGVAWRILDHSVYASGDRPARSTERFLDRAAALGPGLAVAPQGTGSGSQVALYLDSNGLAVMGDELTAGPIKVEDRLGTPDLRPVATMREVTVSSAFANEAAHGWGVAVGTYTSVAGSSQWRLSGDLHGTPLDEGGLTIPLYRMSYEVYGDEGPSSEVSLSALVGSVDASEMFGFFTLDLGASVSHLLQSEPLDTEEPWAYGQGNEAPLRIDGNDVVLQVAGPEFRFLGAA